MKQQGSIAVVELFPSLRYTSKPEDWLRFEALDRVSAARIAAHLELGFIDDSSPGPVNVCQANTEDVLPSYRTAVSALEVFYYLSGILKDQPETHRTIPYPSGPEDFWKVVERWRRDTK